MENKIELANETKRLKELETARLLAEIEDARSKTITVLRDLYRADRDFTLGMNQLLFGS